MRPFGDFIKQQRMMQDDEYWVDLDGFTLQGKPPSGKSPPSQAEVLPSSGSISVRERRWPGTPGVFRATGHTCGGATRSL
ncbi:hypothetical protein AB0I52_14710 [Streptomyces sp. NPDC050423]|uniref:hypothetical protein n=1 Tax=Streptomyces sp. NPDC050423 TaxID=3155402 RepID=UPI003414448A